MYVAYLEMHPIPRISSTTQMLRGIVDIFKMVTISFDFLGYENSDAYREVGVRAGGERSDP